MAENITHTYSKRFLARFLAVQALFSFLLTRKEPAILVKEMLEDPHHTFAEHLLEDPNPAVQERLQRRAGVKRFDEAFFQSLVLGVTQYEQVLDEHIAKALHTAPLERTDPTLHSILQAGVFELLYTPDVPSNVVFDEYINIAHAFFQDETPALVHAVLDSIDKSLKNTLK